MMFEKYTNFKTSKKSYILITSYSYEDRIIDSINRILDKFIIKEVYIIRYDGETYLDTDILKKWHKYKDIISNTFINYNIKFQEHFCNHESLNDIIKILNNINLKENNIILDITGMTKNYIMKFCQLLNNNNYIIFYTRSEGNRMPSNEELSVSINKIIPLKGFEGYIHLDKQDLLILILGYEGNRSLAFLQKFDTEPVLALIGHPHSEDNNINKMYVNAAKSANNELLKVHRVLPLNQNVHSLNPFLFATELENILNDYPNIDDYNVCVSNIGTKLQTLGLFIYWKNNQNIQIYYSIPTRRFNIGSGSGMSWIIKI